jgi:UDP-N-acetyl-D-mannosaminuronic acid transferase (WecB/TagA/CpsF family)
MVIAFDEAQNTLNTLRTDDRFAQIFERTQILADSVGVLVQPRRRTGRQVHRDINPDVNTPEQF